MHILPLYLKPLASIVGDRGALQGVQIRVSDDNTFYATATNSRCAIIVSGMCVVGSTEYPVIQAMKDAPSGEIESIIPADGWKTVFSSASKIMRKSTFDGLVVQIGKTVTTFFACGNGENMFKQLNNVEGVFPNVAKVIPSLSEARASVSLNAKKLALILNTVADIAASYDNEVVVEFHGDRLVIRAEVVDSVYVEAVIMAFSKKE